MPEGNPNEATGNPDVAEVLFIGVTILAVVLAAIIIPGPYPIEGGGGGGGQGLGAGPGVETRTSDGTPSSVNGGQAASRELSLENSSPNGIGLSGPPGEYGIGSGLSQFHQPLPQIPLFVTSSSDRQYWRLASYGEYTGTTWERSPEWQHFSGTVPNDRQTPDGEEVNYGVRLLVQMSTVPTVWQPEGLTGFSRDTAIQVSEDGAFRSIPALPANATYQGRSSRPAAPPEELRKAGRDYPEAIEHHYTGVPELTPAEVGELSDRITAGADSPYKEAALIRDWLRQNKEYSLNVSHEPGQPVVAQFLFAMDAGYCQYFASAMAVMLRTQGIPARYVVGYSPGTEIGENRTLVTALNGHAWVEVYFPGHGWVPFDPTPPGALAFRNPQPPYNISLNRTAVAGAQVTISVEKNGTPVIGAPVLLGERRLGWTDIHGNVSTRLPYQETFNIAVRPPGTIGQSELSGSSEDTRGLIGGAPPLSNKEERVRYDLTAPSVSDRQQSNETTPNQTTKTYRSDTNVTLRVTGTPRVGETVVVTTQIADVPMRNATVRLADEPVGETNASGQLMLSLETIEPGSHRLRVRRGPFIAGLQLEVLPRQTPDESTEARETSTDESLDLSVSAPLGWAFPLTPVTVTVKEAGEPVSNATVYLGDNSVGTTDDNGSLWVWLPPKDSLTIRATAPAGTMGTYKLSGLFANLAFILVMLSSLVGISLLIRRRFDRPMTRLLDWLWRFVRALKRRFVNAFVHFIERIIGGHTSLRSWMRSLVPRTAALLAKLRQYNLADRPRLNLQSPYARFFAWIANLVAVLSGVFQRRRPNKPRPEAEGRQNDETSILSLRQLWADFIRTLPVSDLPTKTPGEVARFAISLGFPEGPVQSLTEAYRDAVYGHREPDEGIMDRLREDASSLHAAGKELDEEVSEPP